MKSSDKIIPAVFVSGLLLFGISGCKSSAEKASFKDVSSEYWYSPFVQFVSKNGTMSGYKDKTFRPKELVTRAEFCRMVAKSQSLSRVPSATMFPDVGEIHPESGAVDSLAKRGWVVGYPNGTFMPDQPITTAELYTIASKVLPAPHLSLSDSQRVLNELSDSSAVPQWARRSVATVLASGTYIKEVTPLQIDAGDSVSRFEAATVLAKLENGAYRTPIAIAESDGKGASM